jgi:hypothetical protein
MFALDDRQLTSGTLLDCPGGASLFGAQVRARGGSVVSVDPMYRWTVEQYASVNWEYVGTPESLRRTFELAVDLFEVDYAPDGRRYVAAELPNLPFARSARCRRRGANVATGSSCAGGPAKRTGAERSRRPPCPPPTLPFVVPGRREKL